VEEQTRH